MFRVLGVLVCLVCWYVLCAGLQGASYIFVMEGTAAVEVIAMITAVLAAWGGSEKANPTMTATPLMDRRKGDPPQEC